MDRCDECGFVYGDLAIVDAAATLRSVGPRYESRIAAASDAELRARPHPDVWSALEYACHVRDVVMVQRERVVLALSADRPDFTPMGREERVVKDRYNAQDPATVVAQLAAAAAALADALDALTAPQWERTGIYHWPTTEERTIAWVARHTVHECEHHLGDIDSVLTAVRTGTTTG